MSTAPFHISFGCQYPREPHPTYPKADGNGYVNIVAADEVEARKAAYAMFGSAWSFVYGPDEEMSPQWFPLGCIETFDAEEVLSR